MNAPSQLLHIARLARNLVGELPSSPLRGSPRWQDVAELRSTEGGGGRARAECLSLLHVEAQVMVGHLTLLVEGVADCLEVAVRRDNHVNSPAMAATVRPAMEVAGLLCWMLDDQAEAHDRALRWLVWRFADLREQRLLLERLRVDSDERAEAVADLDEVEGDLLDVASRARSMAKPTVYDRGVQAAGLLTASGARESFPKREALVGYLSSTSSVYSLVSLPVHGSRFNVLQGLEVSEDASGRATATLAGTGLPVKTLIGLTVLAVDRPSRLLAGWNGVDANRLHTAAMNLAADAGIVAR